MIYLVLTLVVSLGYLSGSIPVGYLLARLKGHNILQEGSGNIGASNVGRTLGTRWGIFVLILDAVKGFIPVLLLPSLSQNLVTSTSLLTETATQASLIGIATIVGHILPFTLGFRGGKGVATGLGTILALSVLFTNMMITPVVAACAAWILVTLTTRYLSLGSMIAAVVYALAFLGTAPELFSRAHFGLTLLSITVPVLVIIRHRTNIVRLIEGNESQWGSKKKHASDDSQ